MFDDFLQSYDAFRTNGAENPLLETVQLFDLLSEGALRKVDLSFLRQEKIDLLHLAQKRKEGMPLEYIIGRATFMGLRFFCSPDTLIPREETELLVKATLSLIREKQEFENDLTIIDMGTGCGNIAVSLAMNSDNTRILASDIPALCLQTANAHVHADGHTNRYADRDTN